MSINNIEILPNELWSLIFNYLKTIDLLYAFNKLNKRFQQMIIPYMSNIDLSDGSSEQFNTLFNEILSSEENYQIFSLALKNRQQFHRIFYPEQCYEFELPRKNTIRWRNLLHIQTLTLTIDHWIHEKDLVEHTLIQLESIPNLINLRLNILFNAYIDPLFPDIFKRIPSTLKELTILGCWKQYSTDSEILSKLQLPSNLKIFAFSINSIGTIYETQFLQTPNNNLEELKIALVQFDTFHDEYKTLKFPTSLRKLHVELPLTDLEILSEFLKLFTKELKSLNLLMKTTIDIHVTFDLRNDLENMINNIFPLLETFQCTIYSPRKILTNITPVLRSFSRMLQDAFYYEERNHNDRPNYDYYFWSSDENQLLFDRTTLYFRDNLDFDKMNFFKLNKLIYQLSARTSDMNNDIISLNNILRLSPNLTWLKLIDYDSRSIIHLLSSISINKIMKLHCKVDKFHHTFLIDLARIIPHIRELILEHIHYHEYPIKCHRNQKGPKRVLTAKVAIDHVQIYFKELIHLYLYMLPYYDEDKELNEAHEELSRWLINEEQQKKFYSILRRHPRLEDVGWLDDPFDDGSTIPYEYYVYVSP